MPGVTVACATVTTSRIDYAMASVPSAAAREFTGLVPVPWGTDCALGLSVVNAPRCIKVWKARRPKALPVKDVAGPALSLAYHLAQAGFLQRKRPAFSSKYFQGAMLRPEHDNAH
eukprot:6950471-Pyramimonas_sp.AAC.1